MNTFRNNIDYFFLFLFFIFSVWIMNHTFGYSNEQLMIAGKAWSDFAAHIPLIRSFSMGDNFPPEYPTYAGEAIRYHYLFYLVVGMIEKMGFSIVFALNSLSALGMTLLLWMIYKTPLLIFRKRSAGLLAVILFLFNGSFSFINFFIINPININSISEIISSTRFSSFGPWDGSIVSAFWNLNIYTNQRHLALSYGLILVALWPLLKKVFEEKYILKRRWYLPLWLIFAVFPILHQAGFFIVVIFSSLWLMANKLYREKIFKVYLVGIILSIISFVQFFSMMLFNESSVGSDFLKINIGFLSEGKDFLSILEYWVFNIGIYFLLIPLFFMWIGLFKFNDNKYILQKRKSIFIFFAIFTVFFFIANVLKLSTDMINNHKLINFFMIGMVMAVAGMLSYFWSYKIKHSFLIKAIIVVVVLFTTLSGFIDLFPIVNDNYFNLDDYEASETSTWIKTNTDPKSIFLTTIYLYNPAAIVGRKTFLDYGYFAWSMGYDDGYRRAALPHIFSSTIDITSWCELVKEHDLDYILITINQSNLGDEILVDSSMIIKELEPVFVSKNNKIYSIKKECE